MNEDIKEILSRPLMRKLEDMLMGIEGNIEVILKDESKIDHPVEYARLNGMLYGYQHCKCMLEAVIRLEKRRGCADL
jgi:hypothetical protein